MLTELYYNYPFFKILVNQNYAEGLSIRHKNVESILNIDMNGHFTLSLEFPLLVAKLLYNSKCPFVRLLETESGKRDFPCSYK